MRRHLYLITEHENEDRVGGISLSSMRLSRPLKNQEAPITVLDDEKKGFREVGKQVGVGYLDFEDEDALEETVPDAFYEKLAEIDTGWVKKAGLDPQEVTA